jgi:aspartyl-tRNA(Asn)/glutamyl-tRNA(Gln) amidotransferase subunit C
VGESVYDAVADTYHKRFFAHFNFRIFTTCFLYYISTVFHKIALFAIIHGMATTTHKEVSEDTLEKLLYLSRLSPESTDMATLKKQVDDIVGYFEILSKYDDSENPYDAYPKTQADKLRDDSVVPGLEISDVKKVSKDFMDGYFQVPKVLGEGA